MEASPGSRGAVGGFAFGLRISTRRRCQRSPGTLWLATRAPGSLVSVSVSGKTLPDAARQSLVVPVCPWGWLQTARLLQVHSVMAVRETRFVPLFFAARTAAEVLRACCRPPPLLQSPEALRAQAEKAFCQAKETQTQTQPPLDAALLLKQMLRAERHRVVWGRVLAALETQAPFLNEASLSPPPRRALEEDERYCAAVQSYRLDRGFYFCRSLCIFLPLQQLAAKRPAAVAAQRADAKWAESAAALFCAASRTETQQRHAETLQGEARAAAEEALFESQMLQGCLDQSCRCAESASHARESAADEYAAGEEAFAAASSAGPSRLAWGFLRREESRFVWNMELLLPVLKQGFAELVEDNFFVPLLHGSVQQQILKMQGAELQLLAIARRSAAFAGPR